MTFEEFQAQSVESQRELFKVLVQVVYAADCSPEGHCSYNHNYYGRDSYARPTQCDCRLSGLVSRAEALLG